MRYFSTRFQYVAWVAASPRRLSRCALRDRRSTRGGLQCTMQAGAEAAEQQQRTGSNDGQERVSTAKLRQISLTMHSTAE